MRANPPLATIALGLLSAIAAARADDVPASPAPTTSSAGQDAPIEQAYVAQNDETPVTLKVYGDTQFSANNGPGIRNSFQAAHLDLFITAETGRLSFLSELFLESGSENELGLDAERLQVSYLFNNMLRARAGRSHTAFGYYNDTYHHGNLFELTTARPMGVHFEDEGGLTPAHLVGVGVDGTFEVGKAGAFRYDVEIGNGRLGDPGMVAVFEAGKNRKLWNVRLRWLPPVSGLTLGMNALYDRVPESSTVGGAAATPRAALDQVLFGAHAAYMFNGVHALAEAYSVNSKFDGGATSQILGGFVELGYALGAITPYVRPEYIRFPDTEDPFFQADATSKWKGTKAVLDLRAGVRWMVSQNLALKFEVDRLVRDDTNFNTGTAKVAYGF